MQRSFEIQNSISQLLMLLQLIAVSLACALFYLSLGWQQTCYVVALLLLFVAEIQNHRNSKKRQLLIDLRSGKVSLLLGKKSQIYDKYKVYDSRWFAILRVMAKDQNQTLILTADCFPSIAEYCACRFCLRQLGQPDAD